MDIQQQEIRRLYRVCREKDEILWALISAIEIFLIVPVDEESLTSLNHAISDAKKFIPYHYQERRV
jgi:hypothetical protein